MLERYYVTPENSYKVGGNRKVIYTPVIVVKTEDQHSHIYLSGRTSRTIAASRSRRASAWSRRCR